METIFEPCTVRLVFQSNSALSLDDWGKMICRFMEQLAQKITQAGPCVIGHIKGFAQCPENRFIKVSVISADHPADLVVSHPNAGLLELNLALNVLVYGHPRKALTDLVMKTAAAVAQSGFGKITVLPSIPICHPAEKAE